MTSPAQDAPTVSGAGRLGQVVSNRYRILQLLGEGGMGAVYLAEHTHMRKRVALKLLHPEMSANPEVLARFEREAMAASHIEHANVAAATDFGRTGDGAFFLVLEYIEGTSLRDALGAPDGEMKPMLVGRALHIVRQIALALERAHEAGIVHRDLKPENIMLVRRDDDPDFVKVLDFGIAKMPVETMTERGGGPAQPLTKMGTVLGTPEYMAPEQALGEAVTPAADLYALGVMLYEMLAGKHPFDPPDRMAMLSFHLVAPVPAMADRAPNVAVPPPVEAVIRRLLEKDAKARYPSARALVEAIEAAAVESGLTSSPSLPRDSIARSPRPGAAEAAPSSRVLPPVSTPGPDWSSNDSFAKTSLGLTPSPKPGEARTAHGPRSSAALERLQGEVVSVFETIRRQPGARAVAIASAVIGFALVAVVAFFAARGGASTDKPEGATSAQQADDDEVPAAAPKRASRERLRAATDQGADALAALAKAFPADPAVARRLALAYEAEGRSAEAMDAVSALLALDPAAASDPSIMRAVSDTAESGFGPSREKAYALLEGPLGEGGVDALLELASNKSSKVRKAAKESLDKPEVRAHASPAAAVLMDLGDAKSCSKKKALLDRAREAGDARVLASLKKLRATRGCGFLGLGDCWSCMHRDHDLRDAIAAIEAREAKDP